jgi:hypothetical protein
MNESRLEIERPFALVAIGWLTAAVGLMLVVGTLYRVTSGRADTTARIALAVGVVEFLIGISMGFGARWAYWPIRILTPVNFVISVVTTVVGSTSLVLWAALFGAATLILWGPARFQVAIRRWRAHQPITVAPAPIESPEAATGERLAA